MNFPGGRNPLLGGGGGVKFDLWCPFSNSDELFQSKVLCENLVWIGWNWRYVNFRWWGGGGRSPLLGGLHVAGNAHFRTWLSYFSQKSCVKIWFGLVEPFKSYRGSRQKTKNKKQKIKQVEPLGLDPMEGAYNNRKHLKIWESALFSG